MYRPMDLNSIKKNIESGHIKTTEVNFLVLGVKEVETKGFFNQENLILSAA